MPRVVFTGGPGSGKTSLLMALAKLGYETVEESARAVIVERMAAGMSPRPDPQAFTQEILLRDIEKYNRTENGSRLVFFDRGVIEAVGAAAEAGAVSKNEAEAMIASYLFYPVVFVLPPWQAIYVTDAQRDHTFAHAVNVHRKLVHWYGSCGYRLHEVPRLPVAARASHVLRTIASDAHHSTGHALPRRAG